MYTRTCKIKHFTDVIYYNAQYAGGKYETVKEVPASDKHISLLDYRINYAHKKSYDTGPWGGNVIKLFFCVKYELVKIS